MTDTHFDRYTRYALGIEQMPPPAARRAEEAERGNRVLHWESMENDRDPLDAWGAIRWNVADAQSRVKKEG